MTTETVTQILRAESADGTGIALEASGHGRALLVVHGTSSNRTTWSAVRPLLDPHVRFVAMDRRGRGGSGDAPQYAIEREYEDLVAAIDVLADETGRQVDVLGHSYGGNITVGVLARRMTAAVRRVVLYEGWPPPDVAHRRMDEAALARLDASIDDGRADEALEQFFRDMVHLTAAELDALRTGPTWPMRVAAAHTLPREIRAFGAQAFVPSSVAAITQPVLLLVGSESPAEIKADPDVFADALPDARVVVLDGQAHVAHLTAPDLLAGVVLDFLAASP